MMFKQLAVWFELLIASITATDNQIITDFYLQLDRHTEWSYILTSLCNDYDITLYPHSNSTASIALNHSYTQHQLNHINEHHSIFFEQSIIKETDTMNVYILDIEYNGLYLPPSAYHTICKHYNYSVHVITNSSYQCIKAIQNATIDHYFEDHQSTICYTQIPTNLTMTDTNDASISAVDNEYDCDLLEVPVPLMIFCGIFCSFLWTIFYTVYHVALLNYPSIYYTKTCIFTLFLTGTANITLSVLIQSPFSFIPNAISVILCIVQFCKYSYNLEFNFSAYSFKKFITFRKQEKKDKIAKIVKANDFSNNDMAKHNPHSIPNRRKKLLYEKQQKMKSNVEGIKFDNKDWIRSSIASDNSSNVHSFAPSIADDDGDIVHSAQRFRSRIKAKYRGHGEETLVIKIASIIFVVFSISLHYSIIFAAEIFEDLIENKDDFRFNVIHALLLFQWMFCLTFTITWYQNYRFEYAIDHLINDGYSLYYLMKDRNSKLLMNENLNQIGQEMKVLSMTGQPSESNDSHLPTSPIRSKKMMPSLVHSGDESEFESLDTYDRVVQDLDKTKKEEEGEMETASGCCKCLRVLSVLLLKLVRYLPWILLLNGGCWLFFGTYICHKPIIWIQHSISVGVAGVYVLFSVCMNEKHLILSKEAETPMNE